MISAERWYEYQGNFSKYGFDMKARQPRQERKKAATTAKDKSRVLWLIITIGIVGIIAVIMAAYGASINYTNNQLKDENAALRGEVEMLQIEIESESNIAEIQDKAVNDLGMVYPEGRKLVNVKNTSETPKNLASTLKKNAFN
jgi:cell division protein FtsL